MFNTLLKYLSLSVDKPGYVLKFRLSLNLNFQSRMTYSKVKYVTSGFD